MDADGIRRVYQADNPDREKQLTALFGGECWREFDAYRKDSLRLQKEILALYRKRLHSIPDVKYVWSFEMRGKRDTLNYFLVFASKHPLGLEKMKEAMKKISQTTEYRFSDADVGQEHLFFQDEENEVDLWAQRMWDAFHGKAIAWDEAMVFALNETPFTNPKSMLACLERTGRVEVISPAGANRRRFTYPAGSVQALNFVGSSSVPVAPNPEQLSLI